MHFSQLFAGQHTRAGCASALLADGSTEMVDIVLASDEYTIARLDDRVKSPRFSRTAPATPTASARVA